MVVTYGKVITPLVGSNISCHSQQVRAGNFDSAQRSEEALETGMDLYRGSYRLIANRVAKTSTPLNAIMSER